MQQKAETQPHQNVANGKARMKGAEGKAEGHGQKIGKTEHHGRGKGAVKHADDRRGDKAEGEFDAAHRNGKVSVKNHRKGGHDG